MPPKKQKAHQELPIEFTHAKVGYWVNFSHKCGHKRPLLYAAKAYALEDKELQESMICLNCILEEEIQREKEAEEKRKSEERKLKRQAKKKEK